MGEGYYPFCPYCQEPAYEEEECVFCGMPYKWSKDPEPPTIVYIDGHAVLQTSGRQIYIYNSGGQLVSHATCDKRLTKRKLRKHYRLYRELRKDG